MAYYEVARTIPSTSANMSLGYVVTAVDDEHAEIGRMDFTSNLPETVHEYVALPERDSVICERCESRTTLVVRDVVTCRRCGSRWRWPLAIGRD